MPPKCFPAGSPCEDEHGDMLCMAIWNIFSYFRDLNWSLRAADFGQIYSFSPQKCDNFFILKAMSPQNVSPLLRLAKTNTTICFAWPSDIISPNFVALFGHLGLRILNKFYSFCLKSAIISLF